MNRHLIEGVEPHHPGPIRAVNVGGGAANSAVWMQLRADITGKEIRRMRNIEVSAVGAAILCAIRAGIYDTVEDAMTSMATIRDVFAPDPGLHEKYEEKYQAWKAGMGY